MAAEKWTKCPRCGTPVIYITGSLDKDRPFQSANDKKNPDHVKLHKC